MTRYILNSGGMRRYPDKMKAFFEEIVNGLGEEPKLLFCFFAEKRENWETKFAEFTTGFLGMVDANCSFELAMPDKFEVQVKNADAIYIHGGDDELVISRLQQFDLKKLFAGKTVATNSAGSDALVSSFWPCDWRFCMDGLGLLPIKFIPHYESDFGVDDPRGPINWQQAHKDLEVYGDRSLPIHALKEAEFIIIEQ